jgi:hypothetical protein
MYSNKSRVPRLLIFIIWLLLILSLISTVFSLSLRVFGLDSPHPIYWLIGYSYGGGPLWSLACIVPVVIGICSVVMTVLLKRYAESIRYQVMTEFVGSVAVLGMIGGVGLIVANMTWAIGS